MKILAGYKGPRGLVRGWAPTFVGYSFQGLGKFGINDVLKYQYGKLLGEDFKKTTQKSFTQCALDPLNFLQIFSSVLGKRSN
eukprot:UN03204